MSTAAVKTIRRTFIVAGHQATMTVPIVAGTTLGITIEWDRDNPPRLMSRNELRSALSALEVCGRMTERELPDDERQGGRKGYLVILTAPVPRRPRRRSA